MQSIVNWWTSKTLIYKFAIVSVVVLAVSLLADPTGAIDGLSLAMECQILTCVKVVR